jgi:hypothetical protein
MKAFHEKTPKGQIATLLAMMSMLGLPAGSIIVLGAEAKLDTVYQTDAEATAVHTAIQTKVAELSDTVEANTAALGRTVKSVDALTLTVIELQIHKIEEEVVHLERSKQDHPASWTTRNERNLNDKRRSLGDLTRQRQSLFDRVVNHHSTEPSP